MKALAQFDEVVAGGTIDTPLFKVDTSRVAHVCWNVVAGIRNETANEVAGKNAVLSQHIDEMLTTIETFTGPVHDDPRPNQASLYCASGCG